MKKTGILITAICCFAGSSAGATYNMMTRWQGENAKVGIYGNYGTPLGEEIRLGNERKKALHIFNLLEASGKDVELTVELHPLPPPLRNGKTVSELSLESVEKELGIELRGEEEFNPVYDKGGLFYQKWKEGKMTLEHNGRPAGPSSDRAFDFFGKRGDNILKGVDGKLHYIDEVDWQGAESLKDYTVEEVKWLGETSVLAFAEHDISGRRHILKTHFRKDEEPSMAVEDPGLLDAAFCPETFRLAGIKERAGTRVIVIYDAEEERWVDYHSSPDAVYLLGIIDGEIAWWNAETEKLRLSDDMMLEGIEQKTLDIYPQGKYSWGEEELLHSASPEKVVILMYGADHAGVFEEKGLSEIAVFETRPRIWLVHERYRSSFDELPENPGHIFLSAENLRVYYNESGGDLRSISSVTLRPAVPTKYLLGALILILVVLVLYDVLKKTKEVAS